MKKIAVLMLLFSNFPTFADILIDEGLVIDSLNKQEIMLGNKLSKVKAIYPNLYLKGERKYSNITLREYYADGIIFSISAMGGKDDIENDAPIIKIEIASNRYSTKRCVSIGDTRNDVLEKYGTADYIQDNFFYYYNHEYEVLELEFGFNAEGVINSIVVAVGT
jgi:hypothetical protein